MDPVTVPLCGAWGLSSLSMADLETLIDALRKTWRREAITATAVDPADLARSMVQFPGLSPDYVRTLTTAGVPDQDDARGFLLWQLDALESAASVLDKAGAAYRPEAKNAVVVADYLSDDERLYPRA